MESIRVSFIQKIVDSILLKITIDEKLKKKLQNLPNKIDVKGKKIIKEWELKEDYKLLNWIGKN